MQVVARHSNRLPQREITGRNASGVRGDENSTDAGKGEEDEPEGALMINMTDGARWFLPVLKPIPAVHLGTRG